MSVKAQLKSRAKHYRDGEREPCFICGRVGLYVIVKDDRRQILVDSNGDTVGACLRNSCFNLLLLRDDVRWTGIKI